MEFQDSCFNRKLREFTLTLEDVTLDSSSLFGVANPLHSSSSIKRGTRHEDSPRGRRLSEAELFDSSNGCFEVVKKVDLHHMVDTF